MKMNFTIRYATSWGERLCMVIRYLTMEGAVRRQRVTMSTDDGELWKFDTGIMLLRQDKANIIDYYYELQDQDGEVLREEWRLLSRRFRFDITHDYRFPDYWRDIPEEIHFYTKAYNITARHGAFDDMIIEEERLPLFRKTIIFRVAAPQIAEGNYVALLGSHPRAGEWNASRFIPMRRLGRYEWTLSLNADMLPLPMEYKYVVVDGKTNTLVAWEEGENRTTGAEDIRDGEVLVLNGAGLRLKERAWRVAGVAVPLFSLRSEHSYGIGDFGDLKLMAGWLPLTGMKIIQLLPINDTTSTRCWKDGHPYNIISAFALHPQYIDIDGLGELNDKQLMSKYHRLRCELNRKATCDYDAVQRLKDAYTHEFFTERGADILAGADCARFISDNRKWLMPYAAFCALRDTYGTAHVSDWPDHQQFNIDDAEAMCSDTHELWPKTSYIIFMQYELHRQLTEAVRTLHKAGIALMADIPIGINGDSAEVWQYPGYFNLEMHTGIAPDANSPAGQNWGFPTYNWSSITADGYRWWHEKMIYTAQWFDAVRLDHISGYFRIWEIPAEACLPALGHFSPALPMTPDEITKEGLTFRRKLFTHPFINDKIIDRLFGIHAAYARDHFFVRKEYNLYELKEAVGNARRIKDYFRGKDDENSLWIRDALIEIAANVLFVEDPWRKGMYHPRYGGSGTLVYDALPPEDKEAFTRIYNNFYHDRHKLFWQLQALRRLPAIIDHSHAMLISGEDLGLLPEGARDVLERLRILTLEVQTMPKQESAEFAHADAYPARSVASISTHDMPPMRLWWEENRERTQRYYESILRKDGLAPSQLTPSIAEEIVARHLYSPSMICMLSLQDWTSMESGLRRREAAQERINVPGDSYNHWTYRMHITIEQLIKKMSFNEKIRQMIERSRR